MSYSIILTPTARGMLEEIQDRRVRQKVADTINRLAQDPEKQGKPLLGELAEFRSARAAGQRCRVVYKIEGKRVLAAVVGVGIRKEGDKHDIYRRLQKLIQLRLIASP